MVIVKNSTITKKNEIQSFVLVNFFFEKKTLKMFLNHFEGSFQTRFEVRVVKHDRFKHDVRPTFVRRRRDVVRIPRGFSGAAVEQERVHASHHVQQGPLSRHRVQLQTGQRVVHEQTVQHHGQLGHDSANARVFDHEDIFRPRGRVETHDRVRHRVREIHQQAIQPKRERVRQTRLVARAKVVHQTMCC